MNFDYTEPTLPDNCIFKISPSGIEKFFSSPVLWYKEHILGEKEFKGNTSTILGTIIHAFAEAYAKGEPYSKEEVEEYLTKIKNTRLPTDEPIDYALIRELYPDMYCD